MSHLLTWFMVFEVLCRQPPGGDHSVSGSRVEKPHVYHHYFTVIGCDRKQKVKLQLRKGNRIVALLDLDFSESEQTERRTDGRTSMCLTSVLLCVSDGTTVWLTSQASDLVAPGDETAGGAGTVPETEGACGGSESHMSLELMGGGQTDVRKHFYFF